MAVKRERSLGEVMGSTENIYTGKVQKLASQGTSAGAELAGKGRALNWSRGIAPSASWLCAILPGTNSSL